MSDQQAELFQSLLREYRQNGGSAVKKGTEVWVRGVMGDNYVQIAQRNDRPVMVAAHPDDIRIDVKLHTGKGLEFLNGADRYGR